MAARILRHIGNVTKQCIAVIVRTPPVVNYRLYMVNSTFYVVNYTLLWGELDFLCGQVHTFLWSTIHFLCGQ